MPSSKDMEPLTAPFYPTIFVQSHFKAKPQWPPEGTDISGKVAIITGSNTGLGLECCHQLLDLHLSKLIMAVRSIEKGETAASQLRSKYPKANIEVWELDMASYDSIQTFVKRVADELDRLDIAILNAGIGGLVYGTNKTTGHDSVIQVNYLSTVLLTILFLPILKTKSPVDSPGRLSIVNSGLALAATLPNKDEIPFLPSYDTGKVDARERYSASKLLAHMFLWKLVDFVSPDDVVVNLPDPGFCKGTELHRDVPIWAKPMVVMAKFITARTTQVGASTYVDAVVVKGKESHGCFLMDWETRPFAALIYTPDGKKLIETLWNETLDEISFANPTEILESMKK